MNATDELRRLLDERGVEWRGGLPTETMVEADELDLLYVALPDGRVRAFIRNYLTPEQAIAATLGAERTCKPEEVYLDNHSDLTVTVCSNCRVAIDDLEEYYYCPWCGAKVVEE